MGVNGSRVAHKLHRSFRPAAISWEEETGVPGAASLSAFICTHTQHRFYRFIVRDREERVGTSRVWKWYATEQSEDDLAGWEKKWMQLYQEGL